MAIDYYAKMESGKFYHVYNRTNNNEIAFKSNENYPYFLGKVEKYLPECLDIWAFCLMPTHFHFLVKVKEGFDSAYILVPTNDISTFTNNTDVMLTDPFNFTAPNWLPSAGSPALAASDFTYSKL